VRVLGLDPRRDHTRLVKRMGVMLQGGGVYPGIRVREAVDLFCAYYGRRRDPSELLSLVGLEDRAKATYRRLSGGEQQRLSLALALAGEPEVVFLDEPTSGVDVGGRQLLRELIRDLAARGACVLLTTHELDEAERVADQVVILARGAVVASGSLTELQGTGDGVAFTARAGLDVAALAHVLGAPVDERAAGDYLVRAPADPALVATLTAWLAEQGVTLGQLRSGRSLEEVFRHAVGER
jgi:ABC-2 type transport system ATP-binding protein